MESCRSGLSGRSLKPFCPIGRTGSNPVLSASAQRTVHNTLFLEVYIMADIAKKV